MEDRLLVLATVLRQWLGASLVAGALLILIPSIAHSSQLAQSQSVNKYLVLEIQKSLLRIGYDPGAPTGVVTNRTSAAIRAFQANTGLPQDGEPTRTLFEQILEYEKTGKVAAGSARPAPASPAPAVSPTIAPAAPTAAPTTAPSTATAAPAPPAEQVSPYLIREIQEALIDRGYKPGPVTGEVNQQTAAAISAFQRDQGQPQTGQASKRLYETILGVRQSAGAAPARPAASASAAAASSTAADPGLVRAIQRALTEQGYDPGVADGIMGGRTRGAILRFQVDAGLTRDGRPSTEVLNALNAKRLGGSATASATPAQPQPQPQPAAGTLAAAVEQASQTAPTPVPQATAVPAVEPGPAPSSQTAVAAPAPAAPASQPLPWEQTGQAEAAQGQAPPAPSQATPSQTATGQQPLPWEQGGTASQPGNAQIATGQPGVATAPPETLPWLQTGNSAPAIPGQSNQAHTQVPSQIPQGQVPQGQSGSEVLPWVQQQTGGALPSSGALPSGGTVPSGSTGTIGQLPPNVTIGGQPVPTQLPGQAPLALPGSPPDPESLPWLQTGGGAQSAGGVIGQLPPLQGQGHQGQTQQGQVQQGHVQQGHVQQGQAWATPGSKVEGIARVVDTGTLFVGGQTLHLSGVLPETHPAFVDGLKSYITSQGGRVSCVAAGVAGYTCRTGIGFDIGQAAIFNGAARAAPDAPYHYKEAEQQARTARKGIWQ